jgi:FMN reductase
VSAYEAANNGFGDEDFAPSGGSAWFSGMPGALPTGLPMDARDGAPMNGHDFGAAPGSFGPRPIAAGGPGFGAAHGSGFAEPGYAEPGYDSLGWPGGQPGHSAGHSAGGANSVAYAAPGFTDDHVFAAPAPAPARHGYSAPQATRATDPTSSSSLLPALANPGPPRPGPAGDVLRLVAVTAGLGQPSTARILADRLADAARARLGERGRQVLVEVLELRDLALDIAGAMVAGFPGAKLRAALDAVEGADGLIAVSPIYTASYSGLFKSFFDVLDKDALTGKPTLIAATGGTARHSLALDHALRPMFAYLRAFIVPTAVFAASEDWASAGESALFERIERSGGELADLMAGTPAAARTRRDEFEDVVPFEQRMAALRSGI